ncbi:CHAT domain-containing protein [Spongiibacter sp. KMU-158]|uniref:CHAT domain-containing protein n=1 Tax=Spongiibacter pelagi TaxID=2760804 RepID=A0A927GV03_9GAMM|nr:CHAT domain-containing protein [Spongiibacter pelagi]MBD2858151.1 CHAT domain-containing protein [Spongiibacter pelagi]
MAFLTLNTLLSACSTGLSQAQWAYDNATQGNYTLDYTSVPSGHVLKLCGDLINVRNFRGFDHCINQYETHHIINGESVYRHALGNIYWSQDYTAAVINSMKAEAALYRSNIEDVRRYLPEAQKALDGNLVFYSGEKRSKLLDADDNIREPLAIPILGMSAVYEGLYGSKIKARDFITQLSETKTNSFITPYVETQKRSWIAKGYIAIEDYQSALLILSGRDSEAVELLGTLFVNANPLSHVFGLAKSIDRENQFFTAEMQSLFCHAMAKLERNEAAACFENLFASEFIDVFGGLKFIALQQYGQLQLRNGKHDAALPALTEAVEILETQRSSLSLDSTKLGFVSDKQEVYYDLVGMFVEQDQAELALEYAERAKARALVDLLASRNNELPPPEKEGINTTLSIIQQTENALATINPNDTTQRSVTRGLLRKYQENLNKSAPEFTSLRVVTSPNITQLQSTLKEDEALLEYFGDGEHLWAFILSNKGVSAAKLPAERLAEIVAEFRQDLQNPESPDISNSSRKLYNSVIMPIKEQLQTFKRLTVVPHGPLHYVPFTALNDGEDYMIDQFELRVLPSASVLEFLHKNQIAAAKPMLILGNPDLGDPAMDLLGAQIEAVNIAKMQPSADVLLRELASETQLKSNAGQYRNLHIASHGIFNAEEPMASALLLSKSESDDGLLSVAELFDLRLNADLVTLSACETGLGDITAGDDVIGFTRGFLYAGAESIISSLWKVSDAATNTLMQTFYKALPSQGKSKALRNAQLALKDGSYSHPYYWAAFQLTGQYD